MNQSRFDKFILIFSLAASRLNMTALELLDAVAILYNPNVQSMINLDASVPVEYKVREYIQYLAKQAPRPFWLSTGGSE